MSSSPRRYIIVPDPEMDEAIVLRAQSLGDSEQQEAGISVRPPTLEANSGLRGDIRPDFSGIPEAHVAGTLNVAQAGVVERARFGWTTEGGEALQLRQSPHVVGRRVDMLARSTLLLRYNRPRLLALRDGGALLAVVRAGWSPIYGRSADLFTEADVLISVLDPETDTWTALALPTISDASPNFGRTVSGSSGQVNAVDMIQFPDTGEIVLVVVGQDTMTPGAAVGAPADSRCLWTYYSADGGATWVERARQWIDGAIPDVLLDADEDGTADDDSAVQSIAMELTEGGRMVMALITEKGLWGLTSDDRGSTWVAQQILEHSAQWMMPGHGVSACRARNGCILFVVARRDSSNDPAQVVGYLTADGVNWSAAIALADNYTTVDVACCISPEGWPHLYGTCHRGLEAGTVNYFFRDWLWGRRLKTRDPNPGNVSADLVLPGFAEWAFHCIESSPSGSYTELSDPSILYRGFVGVDAIEYRGQVLMAATVQRDASGTTGQGALAEAALMLYRLNHWQPLQERLGTSNPTGSYYPGWPAGGRIYNRTWDAYGLPSSWGWTSGGAGAATLVAGGVEGGYMQIVSPADRYFYDQTLPNPAAALHRQGAVRVLVRVEDGGSMAGDVVAIRAFFGPVGTTAACLVRLERGALLTTVGLVTASSGVATKQATFPNDRWLELLLETKESGASTYNCSLWARALDRTADPDWDVEYTLVGELLNQADTVVAEGVTFGHLSASDDATSWWKGVHVSHGELMDSGEDFNLRIRDPDYIDSDSQNDLSTTGTGEGPYDTGIVNVLRASRTTALPAQWVQRGLRAAWRGEAITNGLMDYAVGYDFGRDQIRLPPAAEEWRSRETNQAIEIVLDAGATRRFRPDAVAVFGRNFPGMTLQFNATDSWGAPTVERTFGYYNSAYAEDRYTHLWSTQSTAGNDWQYTALLNRVTTYRRIGGVQTDGYPWRQHQFRSGQFGPRYYVVFTRTSPSTLRTVYRIADNTEDTLLLARTVEPSDIGTTGESGLTVTANMAIFSDCFASLFEHEYPVSYTDGGTGYPNSHVEGYRYCRVLMLAVTHRDTDEAFYRLGYLLLGHAAEVGGPPADNNAAPDFAWGWQEGVDSGSELTDRPAGATSARTLRRVRRTLQADYSYLSPPQEASANYTSPEYGTTQVARRRTWAHWWDLVRRLGVDQTPAALAWEGDRAQGETGELAVPVACDPRSLWLVRVTSPGQVEHVTYEGQTENLPGGDECVPTPACVVRGMAFREEF